MLGLMPPRHTPTHMGTLGSSGLDSAANVQNSRSYYSVPVTLAIKRTDTMAISSVP